MSTTIVKVPNLGGVDNSRVIEVLVKAGQYIEEDTPLITLESDKASMEIPSPYKGTVERVIISVGDKVSEGDAILDMQAVEDTSAQASEKEIISPQKEIIKPRPQQGTIYAGPFVRRMAFELDIDLSQVPATGSGGRVTIEDMKKFLKGSAGHSSMPNVDYGKFGHIQQIEMTRIQRLSAKHLLSVWQNVPQVTQHHLIDITELEIIRKKYKNPKITMISFVMKAIVVLMKENVAYRRAWVDSNNFCVRDYYHIGFACETPEGLVVPVCKNVNEKDIQTIAIEIASLSEKARLGELSSSDLEGSCATISSLGGIGGGHFTPIVNAPDAFILGIARALYQPVYMADMLEKRYMMPISLTYDHRLIDGADGARFVVGLANKLANLPEEMAGNVLEYKG